MKPCAVCGGDKARPILLGFEAIGRAPDFLCRGCHWWLLMLGLFPASDCGVPFGRRFMWPVVPVTEA